MDFYTMLKSKVAIEEVEKNIGLFNALSDAEISQIMRDDTIDFDYKELLVSTCADRMGRLSNHEWVYPLMFLTDKETFKKYYIPRVSELSYTELVFLIKNMYEPECGLLLLETETFKKYIEVERENKGTILQSFLLSAKLYLYEKEENKDFTLLNQIGEDINFFVKEQEIYSEDVVSVIDEYVSTVANDGKGMNRNSPILQKCMDLVKNVMGKGVLMSPSMQKFYILHIVKQLNLDDYVQDIYISMEEKGSKRGTYQASAKKLIIYYDHILHVFNRVFQELQVTDKIARNIICNREYIKALFHELGHVVEQKKVDFIYQSSSIDAAMKDFLFSSWYYSGELLLSNPELYGLKHDLFIEEVRADLFSIMQFSMQAKGLLKGVFNENYLANTSVEDAKSIIEFYTVKTEKGRKVISPMRQFIDLYNQNMPENKHIQYIDNKDRSIMENLMLGFDVPIEIIREISKIATGKIITTNLYEEINRIIDRYQKEQEFQKEEMSVVHK